jgi:hypothetical protein
MTEEEAKPWLTERENGWLYETDDYRLTDTLLALAETRKALVAVSDDWFSEGYRCQLCDTHGSHKPDCLFVTMPRPR